MLLLSGTQQRPSSSTMRQQPRGLSQPLGGSDDVGRQPAGWRSLCPWLVVLFVLAVASSSQAIGAAALHYNNQSTHVECVVAALRQGQSDGQDIRGEYCRSIFPHSDFATVIALPLPLLQCLFPQPDRENVLHRFDRDPSAGSEALSLRERLQ